MGYKEIGQFVLDNSNLVAIDASMMGNDGIEISNMKPGQYHVYVSAIQEDEDTPYVLMAMHQQAHIAPEKQDWTLHQAVYMENSFVGIFQQDKYSLAYDNHDEFCNTLEALTENEDNTGVLPYGAVTRNLLFLNYATIEVVMDSNGNEIVGLKLIIDPNMQ